jgi:uncharacterized protein YjeT (DUF2065 family)
MTDFLAALALAIMLEGLVYAAFPEQMKRMLKSVTATPSGGLRIAGLLMAGMGLLALWMIRG